MGVAYMYDCIFFILLFFMHICIFAYCMLITYLPTYIPGHFSPVQNIINDNKNQELLIMTRKNVIY